MDDTEDQELNITASQTRAHKVIAKDFSDFSGDPVEWPCFMAKFVESTSEKSLQHLDKTTDNPKQKVSTDSQIRISTENMRFYYLKILKLLIVWKYSSF